MWKSQQVRIDGKGAKGMYGIAFKSTDQEAADDGGYFN